MNARADIDTVWRDALTAAKLFAIDPLGLGGIRVRAAAGPVRDAWLEACRGFLPDKTFMRMPAQISEGRLVGELDLAGTLKNGRPVHQPGLISAADDGVLIATMAERLEPSTAAVLASALDQRTIAVERDGISARAPARIAIVALDEGIGDDEAVASIIADRLAFHIELTAVPLRCVSSQPAGPGAISSARDALKQVEVPHESIDALVATAAALGISSIRPALFALRAAKAAAALRGSARVMEEDLQLGARLVLAARATQIPTPLEAVEPGQEEDTSTQHEPDKAEGKDTLDSDNKPLEDVVLEAVTAAIPNDLLARLCQETSVHSRAGKTSGLAGPARKSRMRGRPNGVQRGEWGRGARLSIVDTLRAAAPWQRLRASPAGAQPIDCPSHGHIKVRPEDFRFRRHAHRSEALTVFIVDASGSSALHRLAEAKGAVELLLADCYVRRDHVALIALRGRTAEIVLPPTRALARAKRGLAGLPGGGGTPLASGIEQGLRLSLAARRRDQHPNLVILTDGAANVARDGTTGRRRAEEDALNAGRHALQQGLPALLIDTAPIPSAFAGRLAEEMHAKYFALPMANAEAVSSIVKSALAQTVKRE